MLISAVAVGVFAFVGVLAYIGGMSQQLINSAIEMQGGHVQISGEGYFKNPVAQIQVENASAITQMLDEMDGVRYSDQLRATGMVSSASQSMGAVIVGVNPTQEAFISSVPSLITEGQWLSEDSSKGTVVIGAALAEGLDVLLGERVVLMVNDLQGDMSAGAYRVEGLYISSSIEYDKRNIFLHESQARTLAGFESDVASTIAISLDLGTDVESVGDSLGTALAGKDVEVLTWLERAPMLRMMEETMSVTNSILVVILFLAVGFTLLNSFIMVIFERIREIGIMVAGGVKPGQVRLLFFLEASFIALLGIGVGALVATGVISWWSRTGLDLSAFSEGLATFGMSAVVYPHVIPEQLVSGMVLIFVMVFLSVLWPAVKASRIQVTEALSHV